MHCNTPFEVGKSTELKLVSILKLGIYALQHNQGVYVGSGNDGVSILKLGIYALQQRMLKIRNRLKYLVFQS